MIILVANGYVRVCNKCGIYLDNTIHEEVCPDCLHGRVDTDKNVIEKQAKDISFLSTKYIIIKEH